MSPDNAARKLGLVRDPVRASIGQILESKGDGVVSIARQEKPRWGGARNPVPEDIKQKAVARAASGKERLAHIAKDLGLGPTCVGQWVREAGYEPMPLGRASLRPLRKLVDLSPEERTRVLAKAAKHAGAVARGRLAHEAPLRESREPTLVSAAPEGSAPRPAESRVEARVEAPPFMRELRAFIEKVIDEKLDEKGAAMIRREVQKMFRGGT